MAVIYEEALYNEIDEYAAEWLRTLILAGVIAPGRVDQRSIEDLEPEYVGRFRQVHLFAGIGIWSGALRDVGWPDDWPIWSMSCPCQPFSAAGKGNGFADERHLWPAAFHLVTLCRPVRIVGEQVASPDGLAWIDLVQTDLEGADYSPRAVDTCAAGYGAPNLRQRLYWDAQDNLANAGHAKQSRWGRFASDDDRCGGTGYVQGVESSPRGPISHMADAPSGGSRAGLRGDGSSQYGRFEPSDNGGPRVLADSHGGLARHEREQRSGEFGLQPAGGQPLVMGVAHDERSQGWGGAVGSGKRPDGQAVTRGAFSHVADAPSGRQRIERLTSKPGDERYVNGGREDFGPGPVNGAWGNADWIHCRDGKWRPVESGTFPLAHGDSGRLGRLRAYGNALNFEQAKGFLREALWS